MQPTKSLKISEMFNKHLQSKKINNIAKEAAAPFLTIVLLRCRVHVSADKSHVLKASGSQQLYVSLPPVGPPHLRWMAPPRWEPFSFSCFSILAPFLDQLPRAWVLFLCLQRLFQQVARAPNQLCHGGSTAGNLGSIPAGPGWLGGQWGNPGPPGEGEGQGALGRGNSIPALAARRCQPVHSTEKHTLAACPWVFPEEKFNLIYILLDTSITKMWPLKKVKRSFGSRLLAGPGLQNKKIHVPYSLHKTRF